MKAAVLTIRNPLDPLARAPRVIRRPRRIRALAPRTSAPHIAILNGRPVLRAGWRRRLRDGDVLVFAVLPMGGGGRGGSDPLRTLLSLALFAFAPALGGLLAGAAAQTVLFGTFTVGQAAGLGIALAGQALLNALMPPPQVAERSSLPSPGAVYQLAAQGNQARIEQAIPVQYGRVLCYPDFAAQPYTEFFSNEQYLYQLLCLGAGEFDVEEVRIEDSDIDAFAEVEYEVVEPEGQVTLFPTQVITSVEVASQSFGKWVEVSWSQSGTTVTVTEVGHARAIGHTISWAPSEVHEDVYTVATVPDADTWTFTSGTSTTASGTAWVSSVLGATAGFAASGAGTVANRLGIDIVAPAGIFAVDNEDGDLKSYQYIVRIEARRIDGAGDPLGSWIVLGTETLWGRTTTPVRQSYLYDLATPGRYAVRAFRVSAQSSEAQADELLWSGLRAYLRRAQEVLPVTLIAMRLRATNNLSLQASRRIAVIATRMLPVWDGEEWSAPTATRSIAWAIADAARNADYGAGWADSRIDLDALLALDAVWEARGDAFDARFTDAGSWWEAVSRIAMAGRARCFLQGGVLRVVRDGAATVPVALYSMRNIRRGSFSLDYLMPTPETADAIEVSYLDGSTWTPRRVKAALPGSAEAVPVKLDLFGVTGRAHAKREGLYQAAANRYRRRVGRFSTEMEGFIPSLGDPILVQHDMPAWSQHAEATAWNAGTRTLTVTEPLTFGAGTHYVWLRTAQGGVSGPWAVSAGADDRSVVLAEDPDTTPYTGTDRERTHVIFGVATAPALARVLEVRPRGVDEVEIAFVLDDPSVHTADEGVTAPPIEVGTLPARPTRPVIEGLVAVRTWDDPYRATLSWRPAAGADAYQIEVAEGDDPETVEETDWTRAADTSANAHVLMLIYANRTQIRVRGIGLAAGDWIYAALGDLIPFMWPLADSALMWTDDDADMWS